MKKNYLNKSVPFLLTITLIISSLTVSFGDASTNSRSKCNWISKRYIAKTKITKRGMWKALDKDKDKSCSRAISTSSAQCNGVNLVAIADIGKNGENTVLSGATSGGCSSGIGLSELEEHILNNRFLNKVFAPSETITSTLKFYQNIDENERTVSLTKGNGSLFILKDYPGFAELRFTIWRAKDDYQNKVSDDNITDAKTDRLEYIRIRNNQLEISEGLRNAGKFTIEETEKTILVHITDLNFKLPINDDIDILKEFVFSVTSFSDPDFERITNEAVNKDKHFSVFPNPVETTNNLEVRSNIELSNFVYADLYNASGALIETITLKKTKRSQSVNFTENNLSNGLYFLTIRGKGIFEVHKIIIQRE